MIFLFNDITFDLREIVTPLLHNYIKLLIFVSYLLYFHLAFFKQVDARTGDSMRLTTMIFFLF